MTKRDEREVRVRGDVQRRPEFIGVGRKLVGQLRNRNLPTLSTSEQLADGSVVQARLVGGQAIIDIHAAERGAAIEEVVSLYITDTEGLSVFDLGSKVRKVFTGLQDYEVDGVSRSGKLVYMSGEGAAVRADLTEPAAFATYYDVPISSGTGWTWVDAVRLSPDGTRVIAAFDQSYEEGGLLDNRLGGFVVADAETMVALRPAVRMGYFGNQRGSACWGPGGRIFSAAKVATDSGTGAPDATVTTSTNEYLAVHDADGVLLHTVLVATWSSPPSSAFSPRIRAMSATNRRLYLLVGADPFAGGSGNPTLYSFDITDPDVAPANVASLVLPIDDSGMPRFISVHHTSRVALPLNPAFNDGNNVIEISTADDELEVIHLIDRPEFSMAAVGGGTIDNAMILPGALSKLDNPPDMRRFFLDKTEERLLGFMALDGENPLYDLDLSDYGVNKRFRLQTTSQRPAPGATA